VAISAIRGDNPRTLLFRLNTWNCFGMGQALPDILTWRASLGARLRHEAVIAACAEPDVLCVQELLSSCAQSLFDSLRQRGFTSAVRDDNRVRLLPTTFRGTGLGIGSRMAPVQTSVWHFAGAAAGWDRLARKGALYARFALAPKLSVHVLTVHLQAGSDAQAVAVRSRQLTDLEDLVRKLDDDGRPFVVCGDFNIDGLAARRGDVEYQQLVKAMAGFHDLGADRDEPTLDPHPASNALAHRYEADAEPKRLDYIFFREGRGPAFQPQGTLRILDKPLDSAATFASDHFGLGVSFAYDAEAR
jgi:endonuclease/exonuclease/phosphatase family metal-dependent hydrolase